MLFSWLNAMLRDRYADLDSLCDDMELDREVLEKRLRSVGFRYQKDLNQFR